MSYCKLCRDPDLDTGGTEVCKWPCPLTDGAAHGGDDCRSINNINSLHYFETHW